MVESVQRAISILDKNVYQVTLNGTTYRRTVPSKEFYVHQWLWDSATHAMGLVYVDEQRAFDELFSLVSGQWENGLIAQITFNPNEKKYFPGPEYWGTEKCATGEIKTSGITQPPLLGISFAHVFSHTHSKKLQSRLLLEILPKVLKYHDYLKDYRDPENSGLLTVVHPWETGLDNSPRWDKPLQNIKLADIPDSVKSLVNRYRSDDKLSDPRVRPGLDDYYRYMYLVHLFKSWNWDYRVIVKKSPFAVKDILFNSLWCEANEALAKVLTTIDRNDDALRLKGWADETRQALRARRDPVTGYFRDQDVSSATPTDIGANTIATFLPLLAEAVDEKDAASTLSLLTDPAQFWTKTPVASTALSAKEFDPLKYWRGPTWPITNLFVIEGLRKYAKSPRAQSIRKELEDKTLSMIDAHGFFEYYDPQNGAARPGKPTPLGFGSFSWSAAIYVYLTYRRKEVV